MAQIVLESVSKVYSLDARDIAAVDDVSLEISSGSFISIVGHSGTGKTTLLSIIGGIVEPSRGKLLCAGTDVFALDSDGLSEYRSTKIGFMFQFSSLLPVLTAYENILFPVLFSPRKKMAASNPGQKARALLDAVGLSHKANAYPSQLSGGEQRRIAIARAFVNDPDIIIADEPTGDLDEATEKEMVNLFQRMHQERSVTFILVTHNGDLAGLAPTRYRMTRGRIEQMA